MEHRRGKITRLDAITLWVGAMFVTAAVDLTAADSGARHHKAEHRSPMIAAGFGVELRCATKFTNRHDQSIVEQAALV